MPQTVLHCDGMYVWTLRKSPFDDCCSLFDMDGTLVDSTAGVVGAWNNLRKSYPHLDVENILSCQSLLSAEEKRHLTL